MPSPSAAQPLDPEPDVWPLAALDLEPERCFCLSCGDELPCSTCPCDNTRPSKGADPRWPSSADLNRPSIPTNA